MGRLIVVAFTTLDGVVEDPDGSDGTPFGGWAMRYGPEGVAGDKFGLGPVLEHGTLLFGRRTWDQFTTLWPPRDNPFARAMNAARKAVVTSRPVDEAAWANSRAIDAPLADWVRRELPDTDLAVVAAGRWWPSWRSTAWCRSTGCCSSRWCWGPGTGCFPATTSCRWRPPARSGRAC